MTARSKMTMRAKITRSTPGSLDRNNHPTPGAFTALATVPCWAWAASMRETGADPDKVATVQQVMAMVPRGTDVTSADQVSAITNRRNETQFAGPFLVDGEPEGRPDHLLLTLRRIA